MKIKFAILIFFISSLLIAGLVFVFNIDESSTEKTEVFTQKRFHQSLPRDKDFYETVFLFSKKNLNLDSQNISAGIVPHHLLAGDMIAEFYSNFSDKQYDTVVLLGPNHFLDGDSNIVSSKHNWNTPYGELETDKEMLGELRNDYSSFELNPKAVDKEHSIIGHAGFIKKTFPDAKFLPLIIHPNISSSEAEIIANKLFSISKDKKILVIASVDFAHNFDSSESIKHDKVSISAIKNFNFDKLYDIQVDSPASVYITMRYSKLTDNYFELLNNSNSSILSDNNKVANVTSYITGYFTKGAINFLFAGDLMLDRHVLDIVNKHSLEYLFDDLASSLDLEKYDLFSANLEGAVTDEGKHYKPDNSYDFAFHPDMIGKLKNYNFNFFTIANNHLSDQGIVGIEETEKNLENLGFNFSGCRDSMIGDCTTKILEIKGKKIAMLGFSMVYSLLDQEKIKEKIVSAREEADLVIINIHWGVEYAPQYNRTQNNLAHFMVDSGADMIIGHHPHVIQGLEIYKGKPIFYSLGNFVFDQYFSKETQEGLMIEIEYKENASSTISIIPVKSKTSKLFLMNEAEKIELFNRLIQYSELEDSLVEQVKEGKIEIEI